MSKSNKTGHIKKEALLQALEKTLGVVTSAVKQVGLARSTYYEWYNEDEVFRRAVDDISEIALDYAESRLHKQIGDDNVTSTIFYLKYKGQKRGYIERREITGADGRDLNFTIEIIDKIEDTD